MEGVTGYVSKFGSSDFWTGIVNLFFIVGLIWNALKASAGAVAKVAPSIPFGRRSRLLKLRRFRVVTHNAKYGATPYVASVLEWRNCVRWMIQFLMNSVWFALNASLSASVSDPTINHAAMAFIGAVGMGNLYVANRAADRAWENASWTEMPQAWRRTFLDELKESRSK